jgi:hypothetical protein
MKSDHVVKYALKLWMREILNHGAHGQDHPEYQILAAAVKEIERLEIVEFYAAGLVAQSKMVGKPVDVLVKQIDPEIMQHARDRNKGR